MSKKEIKQYAIIADRTHVLSNKMSPTKQEALNKLRSDIGDEKVKAFDLLRLVEEAGAIQLNCMGYRDKISALIDIIKNYRKKINKLETAFLKQYPDK